MGRRTASRRTRHHADPRRVATRTSASPGRGNDRSGLERLQRVVGNRAMHLLGQGLVPATLQRDSTQPPPVKAGGGPGVMPGTPPGGSTGQGGPTPQQGQHGPTPHAQPDWLFRGRDVHISFTPNQAAQKGFWDAIRDWLRPRPCKFWICEDYYACKPPDKDEDWWKLWKWKCQKYQICRCGLHEPASDVEGILMTFAAADQATRNSLAGQSHVMFYTRLLIGEGMWPLALRILSGASSKSVPSLDEGTWYLAQHAIASGERGLALGTLLQALVARGTIQPSLANWSHSPRSDRGEGATRFTWIEDPVTHERRARPPVDVEIYTPAFADTGWLFSTMMHEYMHVLQVLSGAAPREFTAKGKQRAEFVARDELEAYLWEIEHAVGSGLINNPAQMREVGDRLDEHFRALTPALKAQYRARYLAARRRARDAAAGRPGMSIDEARRVLQESSEEIATLLKKRPDNPTEIDTKIAAIRKKRAQALIEVARADNPLIEDVKPGEPGVYRIAVADKDGRVRHIYGGIQVAWHVGPGTSTSAFTIGEALGAGGKMAVAGTAVQSRVHPFPPDIDFDEHIHVEADTLRQAGYRAARPIIEGIRRISGGTTPGRQDLEFRHLVTFPRGKGKKQVKMSLADVRQPNAVDTLADGIENLNGGNLTTYWRGVLADGRLTEVTRVVLVSASRSDGYPLIELNASPDFNLAFIRDPREVPSTELGKFAWEMCCEAVRRAKEENWLKAAKRAYNYFSTIGDLKHMAMLEPVFERAETHVEQYAVVIDAIKQALVTEDSSFKVPQEPTRILTVDEARKQVERVAKIVESELPNSGTGPAPARIAEELRALAKLIEARDTAGLVKQDDALAGAFKRQADHMRVHINVGVRPQVKDLVQDVIKDVCPDEDKCRKR